MTPTWNDRVLTCDGLTGRISFIWPALHSAQRDGGEVHQSNPSIHQSAFYYRVSFGIPSPYLDHWAVYRQHEVTLLPSPPSSIAPRAKEDKPSTTTTNP
jgi:hypothetical protein